MMQALHSNPAAPRRNDAKASFCFPLFLCVCYLCPALMNYSKQKLWQQSLKYHTLGPSPNLSGMNCADSLISSLESRVTKAFEENPSEPCCSVVTRVILHR